MNPLLQVNEQEIERLNEHQFVDVLNRLLKAEASRYGIPALAVKTTLRINDPDGGIDARVDRSVKLPDTCRIPEGLSVWQYKAGDASPKEIRTEAQKPGIQDAIQAGGAYCFVIGRGCSDTQRKNRETAVNHCYGEKGLPPKGQLLTAQDIADWVSDYPAVAMLPYFNRPQHDDLLTFENWDTLHELRVGYVNFETDDQRQAIIEEIGKSITNQIGFTHVRVAGRAGIGKTRLALEAIRINGLEYDTLYALSPAGIPSNLFSYIEANLNITRFVLVVDECTYDESLNLQRRAQRCGERLLLATIGHDPIAPPAQAGFPLFWLESLENEAIRKIIRQITPTLPDDLKEFIVKVSSGYVKLATAVTESLARNPGFAGTAQLTGVPDVRFILESLAPDPIDRQAMEALSLLRYVGLEGNVAIQGQMIADFTGIDFAELKRGAERMRQRGLVVKRGRYRYVTPHLLAVWFATDVWRARGEDIVDELLLAEESLPTFAAKEALLERLADLGEEEIAAPVVEKLLGPAGLFPTIQALDDTTRSRIFAILAKAAPKTGVATIQRLLGHLPRDDLFNFRAGRRQIIWTLERMLTLEDTFWTAARLLLKLAEAENETVMNNATGTWREIFFTYLSGTPIPAVDRHRLIKEALDSPRLETRLLAVKAIETALSNYESRMRNSGVGGYIAPAEWRPKTWGEFWEVRRSALALLDQALHDSDAQVVEAARAVLMNAAGSLTQEGLADEALSRLRGLPLSTNLERQKMRQLLQGLLHYEKEAFNQEQLESIRQWFDTLTGDNFRDRLRRWVGQASIVDQRELREVGKSSEEMAAWVAEEGYKNPEALRQELEWLASPEAIHFYFFGRRLGELDSTYEWLDDLVAQIRNNGNPGLLSAYLQGQANSGGAEWVEQLLDNWAENEREMASTVFDATWRGGGSDKGVARLTALIDKGWLPVVALGQLMWGGWTDPISAEAMASLLQRLVQDESPAATETALSLVLGWLRKHPQPTETITDYTLELLERPSALKSQGMFAFYWEEVAKFYAPKFPVRLAQAILTLFIRSDIIVASQEKLMTVLREALLSNPEAVWPLIGEALLREDMAAYPLRLSIERWGVEDVDTLLLLEWAEKNKPAGPRVLAQIAIVGGIPLASLPRQLLIRYGQDEYIGQSLAGNFLSGTFVGSEAIWLESKLEAVRKWLNDEHPVVRKWAQEIMARIEARIKRARQIEEEEELIW